MGKSSKFQVSSFKPDGERWGESTRAGSDRSAEEQECENGSTESRPTPSVSAHPHGDCFKLETEIFPLRPSGRFLSEVRGGRISHHAAVFRRGGNLLPLHRHGSQRTQRREAMSPEPRK